jgi:pilus assembly protein Flp/PilA
MALGRVKFVVSRTFERAEVQSTKVLVPEPEFGQQVDRCTETGPAVAIQLLNGRQPSSGRGLVKTTKSPGRNESTMVNFIGRFVRDEEGQDLVEYAMLLAFIALIAIAGVRTLGTTVNTFFSNVATALTSGGGGS